MEILRLLSLIPSALLQNYLNCDRKYLDNKSSYVEITGQLGPYRDENRERKNNSFAQKYCELSRCETPTRWPALFFQSLYASQVSHYSFLQQRICWGTNTGVCDVRTELQWFSIAHPNSQDTDLRKLQSCWRKCHVTLDFKLLMTSILLFGLYMQLSNHISQFIKQAFCYGFVVFRPKLRWHH